MVNLGFYKKRIQITNEKDFVNYFQNTITKTNRDHSFFVNWQKVKKNVDRYKYELNILNSLIGVMDFKDEFILLLQKYPEVTRVFPILVAVRDLEFGIIDDFWAEEIRIKEYNFDIEKTAILLDTQIEDYYQFLIKTGVIEIFQRIKDFYDYVIGVEVGLDTHARKNRGGKSMEDFIAPFIKEICSKYSINFISQKNLGFIQKEYNINIPEDIQKRRCDFLLVKDTNFVNIEVNFYSGPGSKPEEIVDSYINRYNEFQQTNGNFIWITDGDVWNTSTNQLRKAVDNQKYLLNIHLVKKGLLEDAIKEIFGFK